MTIGEAASKAGVNVQTIRYYERRGLLRRAPRTGSGYRQFDPEVVVRLRFIRRAKELGFSLDEIADLLDLRIAQSDTCAAVEAKAKEKIATVEKKIDELERIRVVLIELSRACDIRAPRSDCPILEALSGDT